MRHLRGCLLVAAALAAAACGSDDTGGGGATPTDADATYVGTVDGLPEGAVGELQGSAVEVELDGDAAITTFSVTLGVAFGDCTDLATVYRVDQVTVPLIEGTGEAESAIAIDTSGVECEGQNVGPVDDQPVRVRIEVDGDTVTGVVAGLSEGAPEWEFEAHQP